MRYEYRFKKQQPWAMLLVCGGSAAYFLYVAFADGDGGLPNSSEMPLFTVALAGVSTIGIPVALIQLLRRKPELVVDEAGISIRAFPKDAHADWDEVNGVRMVPARGSPWSPARVYIVLELRDRRRLRIDSLLLRQPVEGVYGAIVRARQDVHRPDQA